MSDGDALLAACVAAPADDAPRLIYADWLEESGEPERAAYVRAAVALARTTDIDRRCQLMVEIDGLLTADRARRWFWPADSTCLTRPGGGIADFCESYWTARLSLSRGWAESIRAPLAPLMVGAAAIFRASPLLLGVRVADRRPQTGPNGSWYWFTDDTSETERHWLPMALKRFFDSGTWDDSRGGVPRGEGCFDFAFAHNAENALSNALVRYGRAAAGGTL